MKCEVKGCKFIEFFEIENGYCDLHQKDETKKQWDNDKRKRFEYKLKYIISKQSLKGKVLFENVSFIRVNWEKILENLSDVDLTFINCTFLENTRFDNINCKNLIFKDCRFLDGGGIKNRESENALSIDYLELGFYELEGDFVVDIGMYAKENGTLQVRTGRIKKLKFNNPQKGSGRIFFVGLNEKLEEGIFVNRVLDRVVFQNCNLKNCYFLNAKVDKAEFRNVEFNKFEDLQYSFIRENGKDGIIINTLLFFLIPVAFWFFVKNLSFKEVEDFILISILLFLILLWVMSADMLYMFFLKILKIFLDKKNDTFLNSHLGTKDEEKIIEIIKKIDSKENVENLKALKILYENLAINFMNTDKQLAGEFVYSSKFYKSITVYTWRDFLDVFPNKAHHFVNGFGQRWFRAIWHFVFTIIIFALLFTHILKPNKDYVATKDTPSFLLENVKISNKDVTTIFNDKSFNITLWENNKTKIFNKDILYGFDNRYNFNGLKEQKIFALKENLRVGFYKSLSNLFYPFNSFSRNWFQNISEKAYFVSYIETIILWIFMIGFLKALWNRIKF